VRTENGEDPAPHPPLARETTGVTYSYVDDRSTVTKLGTHGAIQGAVHDWNYFFDYVESFKHQVKFQYSYCCSAYEETGQTSTHLQPAEYMRQA
jgi:hypothetical protein